MGAPDFYFSIHATARYLHDHYGKAELIRYWRSLGQDYYRRRVEQWARGGPAAIARDWEDYFFHEPGAQVSAYATEDGAELDIHICPAIKHLRECGRTIEPYFCEHCDHICGAMAHAAGYRFTRTGGMGSCRQRFVRRCFADQTE